METGRKRTISREKHIQSLKRYLRMFPQPYEGLDANRMTLLYFITNSLYLFGQTSFLDSQRDRIIQWVYAQQLESPKGIASGPSTTSEYKEGHLAMTYSALCILKILNDDFTRIDRENLLSFVKSCQTESGSFRCLSRQSEDDMRFVYCACAISTFLGDKSSIDVESTLQFILNCQSFDGGFAMNLGQEGHGGSTYCALASLALLDRLGDIHRKNQLVRWLVERQGRGFHGRPNKPEDSCYTFWIGASLHIIGGYTFCCNEGNQDFVLDCESRFGGFSKHPDGIPDILHSYFSTAGLSLMDDSLQSLNVLLGVPGEHMSIDLDTFI